MWGGGVCDVTCHLQLMKVMMTRTSAAYVRHLLLFQRAGAAAPPREACGYICGVVGGWGMWWWWWGGSLGGRRNPAAAVPATHGGFNQTLSSTCIWVRSCNRSQRESVKLANNEKKKSFCVFSGVFKAPPFFRGAFLLHSVSPL